MQALSFTQFFFSSFSSLLFFSLLLSSLLFSSLHFSSLFLHFFLSFLFFSSLLFCSLFSSLLLSLIVSSLFSLCCRHLTGFEMNNAVRSVVMIFSDLFTFLACKPNWNVLRFYFIIRHILIWHLIFWYFCLKALSDQVYVLNINVYNFETW